MIFFILLFIVYLLIVYGVDVNIINYLCLLIVVMIMVMVMREGWVFIGVNWIFLMGFYICIIVLNGCRLFVLILCVNMGLLNLDYLSMYLYYYFFV